MNRALLRYRSLACASLWLVFGCQRAAPLPAEAVQEEAGAAARASLSPSLPPDPLLQTQVLANGVSYLSRVAAGNARRVVLGLVVQAGSLVEEKDEQGLAHFLEHLGFEGTTHHAREELRAFFERAGVSVGAHSQALTSPTHTRYLIEIPSDDPAVLEQAVSILRDWAADISFDPAAIERVRPVLLAEKRATTTAQQRIGQVVQQRLTQGSRWAERADPIGLEAVLQSVSAERLQSFYRRWYQPQNLAVIAVGVFDAPAMQRRVEQHFGSLPKAQSPSRPARFEIPVALREHVLLASDPELPGTACMLTLKQPLLALVTEEDYRRELQDYLLVWMWQRRLEESLRAADAPLTSANATLGPREAGTYRAIHLTADTQPGQEGRALGQLIGEVERSARDGFHAKELERARRALELRTANLLNRTFKEEAVKLADHFLTGDAVIDAPTDVALIRRLLAGITLRELQDQAGRWAQQSEAYHIVMSRDVAALPTEAALRAAAAEARKSPLGPYVATTVGEALMAVPPAPGRIVAETHFAAIDTYEWKLSNGARAVFKATADPPGTLRLNAFSPGGTARARPGDVPALQLAASMIAELGLGSHDAVSTQGLLSEMGIRLTPWISLLEEGVDATGSREHLPALFQAVHLTLSAPGRDATAWAAVKVRARKSLEAQVLAPDAVLFQAINSQALSHPSRASSPPPDAVEQLGLDSLRTLYLERLGDVGDFTFVFVGDSSAAELKPLIEQYLASLPGTERRETASSSKAQYRSGITRVRVQRGNEDRGKVALIFHGNERLQSSAREDLSVLRRHLRMRLMEKLRDDLAGVYTVQVWAKLLTPPLHGHELVVEMDCKPEQCERLKQAALLVISDIARNGASRHHVEALRTELARDAELVPTNTGFWQEELGNAYRRGLAPAQIVATFSDGERISSAALQTSARRYLRLDQYVDALLLPEGLADGAASAPGP